MSTRPSELPDVLAIGCGEHAATTLLPALVALGRARLAGVCDTDANRADALQHRFGLRHSGTDLHRMIDDLRPDAVIMAGPPAMHVDGGIHALEAGCHLFTEKPPAPSTADLQKLASAADASARTAMVGHNLRHTAAWCRMAERVGFDQATSLNVTYHASGPIGGRWGLDPLQAFLLTHVVHVFDLFNCALGPPTTTSHQVTAVAKGRFVVSSQWQTATGTSGTSVISTCAPRLDWNVLLTTSDGTLARITSPQAVEIHTPRAAGSWEAGHRHRWQARTLDACFDTAGYGAELGHFFDCVAGTAKPAPSLRDELAIYQALDDLHHQTSRHRSMAHV